MSFACCVPVVECVYCLACVRWVWKKFLYTAGRESENWGLATASSVVEGIIAVYEDDIRNPIWTPPGGYGIDPDWNADIVVAIRGLNLAKESDFLVLLDDKLGQAEFDGGYVHNGLRRQLNGGRGGNTVDNVDCEEPRKVGVLRQKKDQVLCNCSCKVCLTEFGCEICRHHKLYCTSG
ncbi:hypothetical protein HAX54_034530 [Datura stramonium]|uniref:Mono-/di-acylglycerol lipase N-terminal domain-containing protein n=1 Tax=Datura stramonium TaxID=4076 RepID=A0ABS8VHN2_DATST|nr:hypothetical protein [Datura stramonium]